MCMCRGAIVTFFAVEVSPLVSQQVPLFFFCAVSARLVNCAGTNSINLQLHRGKQRRHCLRVRKKSMKGWLCGSSGWRMPSKLFALQIGDTVQHQIVVSAYALLDGSVIHRRPHDNSTTTTMTTCTTQPQGFGALVTHHPG